MKLWALFFLTVFSALSSAEPFVNEKDAEDIATEAYIYGYPLVTMEMTRRVMTNTTEAEGSHAPMGQFANMQKYPNASFKDVTAPNADTLYSTAWLDLKNEPYILELPNENGRYYLMPMLSGWTDVFAVPGTRTTGTKAGTYAIVGPDWKGTLPEKVTELRSPTNLVWILGRTYSTGTPEDYEIVHKLQKDYVLVPLSSYKKPYTPPKGTYNSSIDMKTPVRDQVNNLDAEQYFKLLSELLKNNPPSPADSLILTKMKRIGLVPGENFDISKLSPKTLKAIRKGPENALEKLHDISESAGNLVNGWLFTTKTGIYGTDYLQRAVVAYMGLGANRPQDAIYPVAKVDSDGKTFNGSNDYVIHFEKGQLPPVKGFWSITMYNDQYFFVPNKLSKYSVSPRDHLKANPDGSVDIYIQRVSPGEDKESNWLPSPEGDFILMLRMYWPENAVIDGTWQIPGVKNLGPAKQQLGFFDRLLERYYY